MCELVYRRNNSTMIYEIRNLYVHTCGTIILVVSQELWSDCRQCVSCIAHRSTHTVCRDRRDGQGAPNRVIVHDSLSTSGIGAGAYLHTYISVRHYSRLHFESPVILLLWSYSYKTVKIVIVSARSPLWSRGTPHSAHSRAGHSPRSATVTPILIFKS